MVSFDEARTCPKCGNLMEAELDANASNVRLKREVYVTKCMTELCSWYGTGRIIQLDNGVVFERQIGNRGMDKTFKPMTADQLAMGQRMVEDAVNRDLRDTGRPD
jgi:hypothetical protein